MDANPPELRPVVVIVVDEQNTAWIPLDVDDALHRCRTLRFDGVDGNDDARTGNQPEDDRHRIHTPAGVEGGEDTMTRLRHKRPAPLLVQLVRAPAHHQSHATGRHHAEPKETERQRRHDPRGAFFLGVVMWTPSIAYLAALKLVSDANAPAVSTMLASLVLIICVLLIIEIPIGLYFFFPDRTERDLKAFNGWLHRHGRTVLVWGLAAAGVYMVAHGVSNATAA